VAIAHYYRKLYKKGGLFIVILRAEPGI